MAPTDIPVPLGARMRLVIPSAVLLASLLGCTRLPSCGEDKFFRKGPVVKRTSEEVEVDCATAEGNRPRDGCITRELSCGVQVKGTTAGGEANFGDEIYKGAYCMPFPNGYGGPERIYALEVPPNTTADIWLDSDCEDLDLFAMRWKYEGKCPTPSHRISECEVDAGGKGEGHVRVVTTTRPSHFLVVVDGKSGVTAPFALSVDCVGG